METRYFETDLVHITAQAVRLRRDGKCPVVIAVDGMAGSGKTTLADLLWERLDAAVIHMDDFFLPQGFRTPERLWEPGGNVYYERFAEEVLPYLRCSEPFGYRVFDAHAHRYTGTRLVEAKEFILVEGSYAHHPAFGDAYDLRIFCETTPEEQLRRVTERDPVRREMFQALWIPMENRYFEAFDVKGTSDIVIQS